MSVMNTATLVRWEVTWIAVELSVSAVALWLMLGAGLAELGSGIFFLLVAVSLFVRWQHYAGLTPIAR
jgi:hypothetical protein